MLAVVVVARVVGAVVFQRLVETGNDRIDIRLGRIEIDDQRADLGAQEVVRAAGAERAERTQILGIDEFEHRVLIVEMTELALLLADPAADFRHQPGGDRAALGDRQALRRQRRRRSSCLRSSRQTTGSPC